MYGLRVHVSALSLLRLHSRPIYVVKSCPCPLNRKFSSSPADRDAQGIRVPVQKNMLVTWGFGRLGGHGHGSCNPQFVPAVPPSFIGSAAGISVDNLVDLALRFKDVSAGWCAMAAVTEPEQAAGQGEKKKIKNGRAFEWGMKLDLRTFHRTITFTRRFPRLSRLVEKIGVFRPRRLRPIEITRCITEESLPLSSLYKAPSGVVSSLLYRPLALSRVPSATMIDSSTLSFTACCAGGDFIAFLSSDGDVYTKGSGFFGQLGHSYSIFHTSLQKDGHVKRVELFHRTQTKIKAIAAGLNHFVALDVHGRVYVCGKPDAIGIDSQDMMENVNFKSDKTEKAYDAGPKQFSETSKHLFLPHLVPETCVVTCEEIKKNRRETQTKPIIMKEKKFIGKIVQIAAGARFTVLLNEHGQVYTAGANIHGECGIFTSRPSTSATTPDSSNDAADSILFPPIRNYTLVSSLPASDPIVSVACGQHHVVALSRSGAVYSWGFGQQGQCGQRQAQAVSNEAVPKRQPRSYSDSSTPADTTNRSFSIYRPNLMTAHDVSRMGRVLSVFCGFYDSVLVCTLGTYMIGGLLSQKQSPLSPVLVLPAALHVHKFVTGVQHAAAIVDLHGQNMTTPLFMARAKEEEQKQEREEAVKQRQEREEAVKQKRLMQEKR